MKNINPINLYLEEENGLYSISIDSEDQLSTPNGNIIKSECRELIEAIVYELQKFYSLELTSNNSITGDALERVSQYSLISTQIDFWEDGNKEFTKNEIAVKIENDPLTNLSPGKEKVDQLYQWREIIDYLKDNDFDFMELQYFNGKKEQLRLTEIIYKDFNNSEPYQKAIFIQLTYLLESIITSWIFVFGNLNENKFATIFTETFDFHQNLRLSLIEDELDEEGRRVDGSFPVEMFGEFLKDETEEEKKIKEKRKIEIYKEIEEIFEICFKFKKVNQDQFDKIETLIKNHETSTLELKSSFSKALENEVKSNILEHKVLQSIVGFLNIEQGGSLILGIDDNLNAIGIDKDKFGKDYDKYRRNFVQKIENLIGKSFLDRINMSIEKYQKKDVFLVQCKGRQNKNELAYLSSIDKKTQDLYLRTEGKVVKLEGKEIADFLKGL